MSADSLARPYNNKTDASALAHAHPSCVVLAWGASVHIYIPIPSATWRTVVCVRIRYSVRNSFFATAGIDRTVRLWNADSCSLLETLWGPSAP